MGVLAIGLLGVGALIPAGRYEIAQSVRLEECATLGRNAFRELKVRGYLSPGTTGTTPTSYWVDGAGNDVWDPVSSSTQPFVLNGTLASDVSVMIDPLGVYAPAGSYGAYFPYGATATDPHLTRIVPRSFGANDREVFDTIFRSSSDLIAEENADSDLPPTQFYFKDTSAPPNPIRRGSNGDYSWIATIALETNGISALNREVVVSVAVFHKRDLSGPGAGEFTAQFDATGTFDIISNGTAYLEDFTSNAATPQTVKGLRPGQWIMVGTLIGTTDNLCRWYRVLSASPYDKAANEQSVVLAGPEWVNLAPGTTRVWIMDNVVNVYEKTLPLEIQ
ncbi:MAG: hypothetical protein DWQ37_20260 [Planctomycetota bacterium]|nr:MAG: hypothetical protein DWQ37_20260 [Planctomycetota bacterium]